ncbi:MAG: TolC family protein [Desulfobacterales bacterium]|nr:TolC family protein [Desulfobacterales bacterium]
MKKSGWIVAIATFFLVVSTGACLAEKSLTVGLISDDASVHMIKFETLLKKELALVAGSRYSVNLLGGKEASIEWRRSKAVKRYRLLVESPEVDMIVTLGVVSSAILAQESDFPKPVIAVGVIDPELQGLKAGKANRSGIRNLTYIHFNRSITRDLNAFYDLIPFQRLAMVQEPSITKLVAANKAGIEKALGPDVFITLIPSSKTLDEIRLQLPDVDAVYVGYLGEAEERLRRPLVDAVTAMKLPSFGDSVREVKGGILAAAAPSSTFTRIARRLALDVDSYQNGEALEGLPVNIEFKTTLTINSETARAIGFSPSFHVISKAEFVGDIYDGSVTYTLGQAVSQAISFNHNLKMKNFDVALAEKGVSQAITAFLPNLSLVGSQTYLDKDVAATSNGTQAERSTAGQAVVKQLLFSDEAVSGVKASRERLEAERQIRKALVLDTAINTVMAFSELLKAGTQERIQEESVKLMEKNLAVAKQRELAGYSGAGDVFSWESRLATARFTLFSARAQVRRASQSLNRLLGVASSQETRASDEGIEQVISQSYLVKELEERVTNPEALDRLLAHLSVLAVKRAPELAAIEQNIAAARRQIGVLARKNWVPTVSAQATWNHSFDRSGAGSQDSPSFHDESWNAAVQLTWPLFAGGKSRVDLARQKLTVRQLKEQETLQKKTVEFTVRQAMRDTITSYVNVKEARVAAGFARKSLNLIADSYSKGEASLTDLVEAQNASLTADLTATNAVYEQMTSILTLERSVGMMGLLAGEEELALLVREIQRVFEE